MKTNPFSKIKTFFHNQIAKIIPLMTNENSTTDSHGWTRIWNQEFLKTLRKGIVQGFGIMLGMFGTGVMAVAVTGTIKTWSSNDKLTANDLNNTITSLKTAIEGIPNWNKNGTSAYYTDGNVGIGTSSPNQIFHVKSTGSMISNFETTNPNSLNYHNFIGSDGDAKGVIGIENSTGSGAINSGSPYGLFMVSTRSNSLTLGTNSTARMTINSSGNIGIGTNSPGANLTVNKSSGTGNSFQVGESGNYTFYGYNNGSGHTYYYNAQMSMLNTNPITFWSTGNSTSVMVRHGTTGSSLSIDASGGVGIGTTTPSVSLHVVGNACTTGTGMTACASDRRLKQNIKPIENALDLILKVKPVHFTWNQLSEKEFGYKSGTQDIGVIAQEIEKINPDWVKTVKSNLMTF